MENKDKEVKKKESKDLYQSKQKDKMQLNNDKIVVIKDGKEVEIKFYDL